MSETRTTCPYCGVGCGVVARTDGAQVTIDGDRTHPANFGKLCVKGANLASTIDDSTRLTTPLIDGHAASWDTALDLVASRFRQTIAEHGPDSVAFYVSGQFLTEDYYVANKLMKGFIGSGNIDTNSRLCMASSVAGHMRAFGEDVVPCTYEDLEQADLVVLVGSNTAWCHPVLFQRLAAARGKRNTQLVVIDPRRTATAEDADLHLPLAAGTDVLLFNGLLTHLATTGALDRGWTGKFATGLEAALALARHELLLALAVDLPAMTDGFLRTLLAGAGPGCGVVPVIGDRFEPLVAVYPRRAHAEAELRLQRGELALQRSGVPYTIIRPGGLTDRALKEDEAVVAYGPGVVGFGPNKEFPGSIPRAAVADLAVAALVTPAAVDRVVEIVARKGAAAVAAPDLFSVEQA